MGTPQVTIITPVFNNELHLEETLRSVEDQTFGDWEHLLVDDGSGDGSVPLIEKHVAKEDRSRLLHRAKGARGPSACRNLGIREARSDKVIFLDADDLLDRTCLESRLEAWKNNPGLDFLVFRMEWFDRVPGDRGAEIDPFPEEEAACLGLFLRGRYPWQTSGPIWNKNFLDKLGGWDEQFVRITDPEIHSRALMRKGVRFRIMHGSAPDCYYRRNVDPVKRGRDWLDQTIRARMDYFRKMHTLTTGIRHNGIRHNGIRHEKSRGNLSHQIPGLRRDLAFGIRDFSKKWLLSRSRDYPALIPDFLSWAHGAGLLGFREYKLLRLAFNLWEKDNRLVRMFRIKGLIYRMT